MARVAWLSPLILLTVLPAAGQTISIRYGTVPKEGVERRLKSFQDSNAKRERQLKQLFEEVGCAGEHVSEQPVDRSRNPNLICTLPGETESVILVGAHFDFVERGRGLVDNWSGSSLLPSLFLSVKAVPRRHTFVFVAFTDEEKGMVGSKFYVHELGKQGLARISAMVNLDAIGAGPTNMEIDRADKTLAKALAAVAAHLKLPLGMVDLHPLRRSDSDSFQDQKIPAIRVHSLDAATYQVMHTSRDQLSAIRLDDYYDTYLLLRVYLAELDQILDTPASP